MKLGDERGREDGQFRQESRSLCSGFEVLIEQPEEMSGWKYGTTLRKEDKTRTID